MEQEELFFFGEFDHALDSQCRVSLPSEWRRGEGDVHLILFPGRDRDLLLFPYEMFREFLLKARRSALADRNAQIALAQIGRVVRDIRPDKQGRIRLEREMLRSIGVENQLKMIGAVTHIKLCSPAAWQPAGADATGAFLDEVQKMNDRKGDDALSLLQRIAGAQGE